MNPLFTLLLTIIQTRQAIEHQRAVELAEIADREREAAFDREAARAAQLCEATRTRERAEKAYKESWAGSRAEAVDEALAWGKRVGVPADVLREMTRMRAQVEHLRGRRRWAPGPVISSGCPAPSSTTAWIAYTATWAR